MKLFRRKPKSHHHHNYHHHDIIKSDLLVSKSPQRQRKNTETTFCESPPSSPIRFNNRQQLQEEEEDTTKNVNLNTSTTTPNNKKSWFDKTYEEQWNPSSLDWVSKIWKLTDEEQTKLLQLKDALIQDYCPQQQQQHQQEYDASVSFFHPMELTRWLRDAHGNVQQAETKFRIMMDWRFKGGRGKQQQTTMVEDVVLPNLESHLSDGIHIMQKYYPSCWLSSVDKDGDPIWLDRIGAGDPWALVNRYGPQAFSHYILWVREQGLRGAFAKDYERRREKPPTRVTAILDMEGLCRRHLNPGLIQPLEDGITNLQSYYGVATTKRILIIRAPLIFRIVWSIAQHFCSDDLKRAIVFCNTRNTQTTLDKYIDREALPPCICPQQGKAIAGKGYSTDLTGGIMPEHLANERINLLLDSNEKQKNNNNNNMANKHNKLKSQGSNNETVLITSDSFISADGSSLSATTPMSYQNNQNCYNNMGVVRIKATSLMSGTYDWENPSVRLNTSVKKQL